MTKLVYLSDTYLFEYTANIVENKLNVIILSETIFHPQGGGQPSDIGIIKSKSAEFEVEHVTLTKEGIVEHSGKFIKGIYHTVFLIKKGERFEKDEQVQLIVNKQVRIQNAICHSAGHLMDVAIKKLGYDKWEGTV